jgi:hypothetical protein
MLKTAGYKAQERKYESKNLDRKQHLLNLGCCVLLEFVRISLILLNYIFPVSNSFRNSIFCFVGHFIKFKRKKRIENNFFRNFKLLSEMIIWCFQQNGVLEVEAFTFLSTVECWGFFQYLSSSNLAEIHI